MFGRGVTRIMKDTDTFNMKTYSKVLTIAGSDSVGGAGIQADIKAISATGGYAASAITAITVQNTMGVSAVHNVPLDIVRGQIDAVITDIGVDAIKIGMLSTKELVRAVKEKITLYNIENVVLDPVMVATSGDRLLDKDAEEVLKNELAPYARVITPNVPEAEILSGKTICRQEDLPGIGKELSEKLMEISGRKVSVLMKAGHLDDEELVDYFYNAEEDHTIELRSKRVHSVNTHGTGCTLSSAFASYLAQGFSLDESAIKAKAYIAKAIESGADYQIGHGHGPVNHFWKL